MLGYYGECLGERSEEVIAMAQAQAKKEPITERPADLLTPEWDELVEQASALDGFDGSEEDVLTNAMFPGVAPKFFAARAEGPKNVGKTPEQLAAARAAAAGPATGITAPVKYNVSLAGRSHSVTVEPA